jgi:hypothetical protein
MDSQLTSVTRALPYTIYHNTHHVLRRVPDSTPKPTTSATYIPVLGFGRCLSESFGLHSDVGSVPTWLNFAFLSDPDLRSCLAIRETIHDRTIASINRGNATGIILGHSQLSRSDSRRLHRPRIQSGGR